MGNLAIALNTAVYYYLGMEDVMKKTLEVAAHTPGPWSLKTVHGGVPGRRAIYAYNVLGEKLICAAPTDEANAKLIAAAPELLCQLKLANDNICISHTEKQEINECDSGVDYCDCPLAHNWRNNRAAIIKAESRNA